MGDFKVSIFLFLFIFVACGRTSQTEIKVFKFNIDSNAEEKTKVQALIKEYNLKMGFTALTEVLPGETPNSSIVILPGLTVKNPGKVGFGKWTADIQSKGLCNWCAPTDQETDYSMHIELDKEFFDRRMNSKDPADQTELTTLFFHEIGHGLTMDHLPSRNSVMFAEITCLNRAISDCGKDFSGYLTMARRFFSIAGNL